MKKGPEQSIRVPDTSFFYSVMLNTARDPLPPKKVRIISQRKKWKLPMELQERAGFAWEEENRRRREEERNELFNGQKVRLTRFSLDGRNLCIVVNPTDFTSYFLSKSLPKEERRSREANLANPLGVAIIVSAPHACEGRGGILISQRGKHVLNPGFLEIPAGSLDKGKKGAEHPLQAALRELEEEQGIQKAHLKHIRVLGLAYEHFDDACPTLIVTAELKKDADVIISAVDDRDEGRPMWNPTDDTNELVKKVLKNSVASLSCMLAGIQLYLESIGKISEANYFGERLARRGRFYDTLSPEQLHEISKRKINSISPVLP